MQTDRSHPLTIGVIGVLVLALAGGIAWMRRDSSAPQSTMQSLPTITSTDATAKSLWQLDGLYRPIVTGDQVVGYFGLGKRPVVRSVSARDGTTRWTYSLPASEPYALELLAAQGVVVAVVGEASHTPSGGANARLMLVVDARDGSLLWSQAVGGFSQKPPVAIAENLVVTGDSWGTLNARNARTGIRAWRRTRPAACPQARVVQWDEAVVADGPLLAASYQCSMETTRRTVIERLDVSSGAPLWSWVSPEVPGPLGAGPIVVGVESATDTIVAAGTVAPSLTAALGHARTWPSSLGTPGNNTTISFDATTGRPRWNEYGSSGYDFAQTTLVNGAVCESVVGGFECRDDVTGVLTRPPFMSGNTTDNGPPIADDGLVGFGDQAVAAVTAEPATDSVAMSVMPIRGTGPLVRLKVTISTTIFNGAHQGTFVVAGGSLSDETMLVLIRRIDVRGYPILAIGVTPRR